MTSDGKLTDLEKMAVDSVIKRQQSLLDLMRHTDLRSQQFIVAYAGFTGAALLFAQKEFMSPGPKAKLAGAALLTYAVAVLLGAMFGFAACWYARVGLPSRGGDFWIWAMKEHNRPDVISKFLENAEQQIVENESIQRRAARMLRRSMVCGAVAVLAAGLGSIAIVASGL